MRTITLLWRTALAAVRASTAAERHRQRTERRSGARGPTTTDPGPQNGVQGPMPSGLLRSATPITFEPFVVDNRSTGRHRRHVVRAAALQLGLIEPVRHAGHIDDCPTCRPDRLASHHDDYDTGPAAR